MGCTGSLQSQKYAEKSLLCCNKHPLTKRKAQKVGASKPCNNCSAQKQTYLFCQSCGYKVCHSCNPIMHQDFCKASSWKIGDDKAPEPCHYCDQRRPSSLNCLECGINICYSCKPFKHSEVCLQKNFQFESEKNAICHFCSNTKTSYQQCQTCKLRVCDRCRQSQKWE